jgi:hypothetical protein
MPVPKGKRGVEMEMKKFKLGELHSGSKTGPLVRSKKQAIAISLSESGMSNPMKKALRGSGTFSKSEIKQGHRKLEQCPMGMGRPMVNPKK